MKLEDLKTLISYHDDLYYNEGRSEISDAEYDALREKLESIEGKQESVPGTVTGLFQKYKHVEPIASLAKVNDEATLRKEIEKLMPVIIMPKYDGLTVVKYPDASVTRGDGETGDDISANFDKICLQNYPYPVRGEAIISRFNFEILNRKRIEDGEEPFKNARNAAAGILRSKDSRYHSYVSYVVYDAVGSEASMTDDLRSISEYDFTMTDYWLFDDLEAAVQFVLNFDKDNYLFELDGLVVKTNQEASIAKFGRTGHHPKDAFAYKFPTQSKWTLLNYVHWTVGRTGKVVPNAVFDPVELLSTTVSNATLHNPAYIKALGLSEGCLVEVTKANDIIPAIIRSKETHPLHAIRIPENCPECGEALTAVKDQLYCSNEYCKSRLIANAAHLASKSALDITGLSESTVEKLIQENLITEPYEILSLTKSEILSLEGFGAVSANKLYLAIQQSRNTTMDRVIVASGIPLIGKTASKLIAKCYKDILELERDATDGFGRLQEVDGIGSAMLDSLYNHMGRITTIEREMLQISNPFYTADTVDSGGQNDLCICVTGKFDQPRDYYQGLIEDAGATFASSVTKKVTHLLAGDKAGSKLAKAEAAGILILTTEAELKTLLGGM